MMSARGLQRSIGDSGRWGEAVGATRTGVMVVVVVVFSPVGTWHAEGGEARIEQKLAKILVN